MAENKNEISDNENQSSKEKPKKKSKLWCCIVIPVIFFIIIGLIVGFKRISEKAADTRDKKPAPARNYQYPQPSSEAANRQIDCNALRKYKVKPKNVLCLNLYKTSADDLKTKLSGLNYDNIVLYGERIFFDVATNIEKPANLEERIYNVAKFTDLIALPKLMQLYNVEDLSYINKDFSPFPALYYEVRNQKEVNETCGSKFNIGGCSQFHYWIVLAEDAISPSEQRSRWRPWSRNETDDQLFYQENVPSDCYISHIINHETAHTLLFARVMKIGGTKVATLEGNINKTPRWFNEEQAGVTEVMGSQWICGADIISELSGTFSRKVQDANFLKFQSVFPSNAIAGGGMQNDCQKAILTAYYRVLSKGKIEEVMPSVIEKIRQKSMIKDFLKDDKNFANLMLELLGNDPKEKEFLNSKGCGI